MGGRETGTVETPEPLCETDKLLEPASLYQPSMTRIIQACILILVATYVVIAI